MASPATFLWSNFCFLDPGQTNQVEESSTPPKFNIAPEKWMVGRLLCFGMCYFQFFFKLRDGNFYGSNFFFSEFSTKSCHCAVCHF